MSAVRKCSLVYVMQLVYVFMTIVQAEVEVASQPGHDKIVAWYRLPLCLRVISVIFIAFAYARNIRYIFRKIVLSTLCQLNTEYYTSQDYGHCQCVMLASLLVEHAAAQTGHDKKVAFETNRPAKPFPLVIVYMYMHVQHITCTAY